MARHRLLLALGFALAAAGAAFLITTAPGPGLDPDAMSYLGAAESFRARLQLRIPEAEWSSEDSTLPLGHFPPGFPLAIAAAGLTGLAPVQSARAVEVIAAGVMAGAGVWLAAAEAGPAAGVLLGVLLFVSQPLASDHIRILSEPLFLALLMATLALARRMSARPLVWGVGAALATLVRYVGLAPAVGLGAVAWAEARERHARLRAAALAAGPAVLVHLIWTVRTHLEEGEVRRVALHGGLGATLREGWETVVSWLAPVPTEGLQRFAVALAVAAALALLLRSAVPGAEALWRRLGLLAACYAGFVLVSRVAADPVIPLDDRMLSPLFLLADLGIAIGFAMAWPRWSRPARGLAAAALALWMAGSAAQTARFVHVAREGGWGYAQEQWRSSSLVTWLRSEGRRHTLFTNNAAGVYFSVHRTSRGLPETLERGELLAFADALRRSRGVIVEFRHGYNTVIAPDELARRLGLVELVRAELGVVWGFSLSSHL